MCRPLYGIREDAVLPAPGIAVFYDVDLTKEA